MRRMLAAGTLGVLLSTVAGGTAAADNRPQRLTWLQDAGFGMFVHWSLDSQIGSVISHSLVGADTACTDWFMQELPRTFNPKDWDPEALADVQLDQPIRQDLALGDARPGRQAALVVEHQVQLDSTLGSAVARPVEDLAAQVDRTGVDATQRVLAAERPLVPRRCWPRQVDKGAWPRMGPSRRSPCWPSRRLAAGQPWQHHGGK